MVLGDFRIGWRRLVADPSYSLVAVLGLGVALTTVVLFLAYMGAVLFGASDVRDAGRVIRLETMVHTPGAPKGWLPDSAMVFQEHWAKAGAPVESA